MKHSTILLSLCLLLSFATNADIIYKPHTDFGTAFSLEGAAGLEKPFTKHNSAAIVGILGAVSMAEKLNAPAAKAQLAIEVKHYFKKNTFSGFNIGLNAGLNFMRLPEIGNGVVQGYDNTVGFVPGLKLSYLKKLNASFQLEPYVEASAPWYSSTLGDAFDGISNGNDPGMILTIGLRVGFNKLLKKETDE